MKLEERIILFSDLGKSLNQKIETEDFQGILAFAKSKNGWFTIDNLKKSIQTIIDKYLNESELRNFVALYPNEYFEQLEPKKVGVIAAGNIPLVGFQDIIHVILFGHLAVYKASSQDEILIQYILKELKSINPAVEQCLVLADRLNNMDAYIATGSGNTSRYFDYYFGGKPNIIRKNRTSVAVLTGEETKIELADLGNDIFSYFGLGCRNIAKLYVPVGYDFTSFFEAIEYWNTISMHSKYNNNYDYMKSIYLVNGVQHLDNGFVLLKNDENLASPISTLFYENYTDLENLKERLESQKDEIQVVVSKLPITPNSYRFGESQSPGLADYADNVDTMEFLASIAH
ncbi:acyl-CoA reductase [Lacihabitans soyangensis]|uniref:Acyl-CoA reductase n=1 Tax=Lacihabitans soyangensis TaxID=869394 RepID=A0AAE3KUS7_9BACT|nr:acyl-CoA reductase [Lacihabitans soyangensis]MCP9765264.1 acyl-CoA reductase [Lacihabitans soyangensis]